MGWSVKSEKTPSHGRPAQALKASGSLPVCASRGTFLLLVKAWVLPWEVYASKLQAVKVT